MGGQEWVFTFGQGQRYAGRCVRIKGDFAEARKKMFSLFGEEWAFQYSAEEWDNWLKDPERAWYMEKEMAIDG